ncbi:MAG: polyphosphate kinase 2 family protein [Flavobacteriales bacterium]|jgi:PPK2 family polyphosphate:nucleotide phosphotransferase|nr:MAG: polyphosphate kinase 2 family protein [Flavobacteriales bacterium]
MSDPINLAFCRLDARAAIDLGQFPTDLPDVHAKKALKASVETDRERIAELQEVLYAQGSHALLLVFQAMDAAGKDSCIRHVLSGVNPQGCQVSSFKAPSHEELAHDFLWRHAKAVPARGMIGVHNRSHYEEVLVVKVHPTYLAAQRIPGVDPAAVAADLWEGRYAAIRAFEAHLAAQGVSVLKFFLHMSKATQKERFLERIDDPDKQWKFNAADVKERGHWEAYQRAYAEAIGATAAPHAPWYIVPADDQWETRAIVGRLVRERLEAMDLRLPGLDAQDREGLRIGREQLMKE